MELNFINGDLFNTNCDIIAHQVNCTGVMGSGVASKIKEIYPNVYKEYNDACSYSRRMNTELLGGMLLVKGISSSYKYEDKYIANIFGQYLYLGHPYAHVSSSMSSPCYIPDSNSNIILNTDKMKFTSYEAVYRGLLKLRLDMNINELKSVAFPYKFGSDRGGADWNIILSMIRSVFEGTDIKINIYKLN